MAAIGRKRSRKKSTKTRVVYIGKRKSTRSRSRRVGGTSAVGRTRKRKRVGSTGGSVKQIAEMAVGIGVGAAVTHMGLRPLEEHVVSKYPMAGKFMGAAEILLGGYVGLKAKNALVRGVGFGVMAGGVHTVMHQFHLGKDSPAIKGPDYVTSRIPITQNMNRMMNGMIQHDQLSQSSLVAGRLNGTGVSGGEMGNSSADIYRTYLLAGMTDEESTWLDPKGYNY